MDENGSGTEVWRVDTHLLVLFKLWGVVGHDRICLPRFPIPTWITFPSWSIQHPLKIHPRGWPRRNISFGSPGLPCRRHECRRFRPGRAIVHPGMGPAPIDSHRMERSLQADSPIAIQYHARCTRVLSAEDRSRQKVTPGCAKVRLVDWRADPAQVIVLDQKFPPRPFLAVCRFPCHS